MKKWILIILAVAFAFWLFSQRKKVAQEPIQEEAVVAEEVVAVPQTTPLTPVVKTPPPPPAPHILPPVEAPKKNLNVQDERKTIPTLQQFKVDKDGWAVAYGDVLLGKPPKDMKEKVGFTKVQTPQAWEITEIPYIIPAGFPSPERITQAFEMFKDTPIAFVPYNGQPDALVFENKEGNCRSYLGKIGGLQPILLSTTCGPKEIAHELMHALGFVHEHSRTDRDEYVKVIWENVQKENEMQFAMVPEALMEPLRGTDFDHQSIMIYPDKLFAKVEGQNTLESKSNTPIAPSEGLSRQDIERVIKYYR